MPNPTIDVTPTTPVTDGRNTERSIAEVHAHAHDGECKPECLVTPLKPLPDQVIVAGDHVLQVEPRSEFTPVSTQEVYRKASADLHDGLFVPGQEHKAIPAYNKLSNLFLMKHGVDPNLPPEVREENADLLPGAAQAALLADKNLPDAAMMKLDGNKVSQGLSRIDTLTHLHGSVSWIGGAVRNNIAHAEKEVGGAIRQGVKRIGSLLEMDFTLKEALGRTLRWIELPSKRAQETKRDREQVASKAREDLLKELEKEKENKPKTPDKGEPPLSKKD